MTQNKSRLAIDVGGTFIDFVYFDSELGTLEIEKQPSIASELPSRIMIGIEELDVDLQELGMIIHGSTTVINTILQEKGARIAVITTAGFRDVLQLGRGARPEVFNLQYKPQTPLVERYLRFEVPERMAANGEIVTALDETMSRNQVRKMKDLEIDGIAVCLLNSFANPAHEIQLQQIINDELPNVSVSISSDVTREFREFERTSTVVMNTYVKPRMSSYLAELDAKLTGKGFNGNFTVMQSTGGMLSRQEAERLPIRTLESGPAGGVIGAVTLARQLGIPNLIASDVGGTSFDVSLILDGDPVEKSQTIVNRRPVLQPTIDIESVGAGGGSIAWVDDAGGFYVGPMSAEADPGPVCFGRGGTEPTVTDAHLVLGRINPDNFWGNRMKMDVGAARKAIEEKICGPLGLSLEKAAYGITHLADINMINAIRVITLERGHDPRDLTLLSYGGGGGLFAAALLEELELRGVVIPQNPAVFSAWGILNADYREDTVRTSVYGLSNLTPEKFFDMYDTLAKECLEKLSEAGIQTKNAIISQSADMRYENQEHTVTVPIPSREQLRDGFDALNSAFDGAHERMYGHSSVGMPTELVTARVAATVPAQSPPIPNIEEWTKGESNALLGQRMTYFESASDYVECPFYDRTLLRSDELIAGPAIIEEWNSTVVVRPHQQLRVDEYGNLHITRESDR